MSIGFHFVLFLIVTLYMALRGSNKITKLMGIPVYSIYDEERQIGLASAKCQMIRGGCGLICILIFLSQIYFTDPDPFHFRNWCLMTTPMIWPCVIHFLLLTFRSDFYNEERGTEVMGKEFYYFPISHIDVLERYLGASSISLIVISFLFMMPDDWGVPFIPKLIILIIFLLFNSVLFFPVQLKNIGVI